MGITNTLDPHALLFIYAPLLLFLMFRFYFSHKEQCLQGADGDVTLAELRPPVPEVLA